MPTTDRDIQALTYLACRIRKETYGACEWDEAGTHAVIAKLVGQNMPSVVERVTRHAGDPEAKTPGAINRPFVPAAQVGGPRFPVKAGEDCRTHVGEDAHACRACAADRLVGTTTQRPTLVPDPPTVAYLAARRRPTEPTQGEPA